MLGTVMFALLGFLVFMAGAYVAALLIMMVGGELLGISQAEGAYAMMVAFTIAPVIAIVSGIAGAVLAARWARRRAAAQVD